MKFCYLLLLLIGSTVCAQVSKTNNNELFTLCKVWGLMKYYHPSVSQGKLNWDSVLLVTLEKKAYQKQTPDKIIGDWFAIANKQVAAAIAPTAYECDSITQRNYNITWINNAKSISSINKSRLLELVQQPKNIGMFYSNPKQNDIRFNCSNEKVYAGFNSNVKLLELFRVWNVIEYFYPYKYLLANNWDVALKKYIPIFSNINAELAYKKAITQLAAEIQDTHVHLEPTYNYDVFGKFTAPFTVQVVNNGAVVTIIKDETIAKRCNIEVGDFITKVNGKQVADIIKLNRQYMPASNESVVLREAYNYLFSGDSSQFSMEATKMDGRKYKTDVARIPRIFLNEWDRDGIPAYHLRYKQQDYEYIVFDSEKGGVRASTFIDDKLYVEFSSLLKDEIDSLMISARDTKGIVFDLRGYNDNLYLKQVLHYLFPAPQFFGIKTHANFNEPGKFCFEDNIINKSYKLIGINNTHPYKGKVMVLINEYTQSAAELWGMIFKKVPNVVFVGSQTAGADGNQVPIKLTNGSKLIFSGFGIYYPDGSETQRIGIKPDVVVRPTKESIQKKEDVLLAKAFELIDKK